MDASWLNPVVDDPSPYKITLVFSAVLIAACLSAARAAKGHGLHFEQWIVDVAHLITAMIFTIMLVFITYKSFAARLWFVLPWLSPLIGHEQVAFDYGLIHSTLLIIRELCRGLNGHNGGRARG